MSNNYQYYANLADSQAQNVTKDVDSWTGMLETAARLYKYPFCEQLLIHAQNPNATACATIQLWNKSMNRYVKRGTKGIALLDNVDGKQRLKYVFDVADTQDSRYGSTRLPQLWQMKPEYEGHIAKALGRHIEQNQSTDNGLDGTLNIQLIQAIAKELVGDYIENNDADILQAIGDDENTLNTFTSTLVDSTVYSIMTRCGMDTTSLMNGDAFQNIGSFNTPKTLKALGQGISSISENVLREIESTIKQYEKEQQLTNKRLELSELNEGREYDGHAISRDNLSLGGGLSDSRHRDSERSREPTLTDQIRNDAQSILGGTEGDNLYRPSTVRGTVPTLPDERGTSGRTPEFPNETTTGTESTTRQSSQSDGLGSAHEHVTSPSGRSGIDGTDLYQLAI